MDVCTQNYQLGDMVDDAAVLKRSSLGSQLVVRVVNSMENRFHALGAEANLVMGVPPATHIRRVLIYQYQKATIC